jgi:hypothetical protein
MRGLIGPRKKKGGTAMNRIAQWVVALVVALAMTVSLSPSVVAQDQSAPDDKVHELANTIVQQIHDMPDYGAFDWISVYVSGTPDAATVTLVGDVSRLLLKTNIGRMLDGMDSVSTVNNNLVDKSGGPSQAGVRTALYNNIYTTYLPEYSEFGPGERAVGTTRSHSGPHPIHIIVDEQMNVSLEGHVFSAKDKSEATMACERTQLTNTCTNDLVIVPKPKS